MNDDIVETALATAAGKLSFLGAGIAGTSWFFSNEFFGLMGVAIGIVGLAVTWYYKAKANFRNQEEHDLRMRRWSRKDD